CPPWHPLFHLNLSILLPIPPENIPVTLDFGEDTYRINYHLQGRLTFTGLYQGWDENSGVELNTEIRIKEMVMLGVKGAIIDDETVVTPFIRLDFNDSLKRLDIM
ncbi:MAG: hypothetical protein D3918_14400, partial [Candidatus Electrothrix sp. AX2]|nr:hypothetical protein [Candidatus Electrothrix gigas]